MYGTSLYNSITSYIKNLITLIQLFIEHTMIATAVIQKWKQLHEEALLYHYVLQTIGGEG